MCLKFEYILLLILVSICPFELLATFLNFYADHIGLTDINLSARVVACNKLSLTHPLNNSNSLVLQLTLSSLNLNWNKFKASVISNKASHMIWIYFVALQFSSQKGDNDSGNFVFKFKDLNFKFSSHGVIMTHMEKWNYWQRNHFM